MESNPALRTGPTNLLEAMIVAADEEGSGVDDKFFPDAASFKPERWLGEKTVPTPFGAGPRTCPGRYLALLEIKIAMAMLLGSFKVEPIGTPDDKEAQELMGFVMSPLGFTMRLRKA